MVSYTEWTEVVWARLDAAGLDDVSDEIFEAITSAIGSYWQNNKQRLKRMAANEARKLADELIRELVSRGVLSA